MAPVGPALADAQHPCHEWLAGVYGRVASLGIGYSATHLSLATERGTSLVATCQHCAGGLEAIRNPEGPPPPRAIEIGMPARLEGDRALSPLQRDHQRSFLLGYLLFAPALEPAARADITRVLPRNDIALAAVSGKVYRVTGHLGLIPPDRLEPRAPELAPGTWFPSPPIAEPLAGQTVLALGFPREAGGDMVFSAARVLGDDEATAWLARADPEEAAIPYEPEVEIILAVRSIAGMSGGGVFDRDGRYLGVMVRASTRGPDYITRVVRAPHIARRLREALAPVEATERESIAAFLDPSLLE